MVFKVEPFNLDIMSSSLEKLIYDHPFRERKWGKNGRTLLELCPMREYDIQTNTKRISVQKSF